MVRSHQRPALRRSSIRMIAALGGLALAGITLVGCSSGPSTPGSTSISFMAGGNDPAATKFANTLATGFHKANPTITVKVNTRPGGADGDNLIKTRLSYPDALFRARRQRLCRAP